MQDILKLLIILNIIKYTNGNIVMLTDQLIQKILTLPLQINSYSCCLLHLNKNVTSLCDI